MNTHEPVVYRLSHPQKRIWYTEQLYPYTCVNHIGGCVRVKGRLDFNVLETAIHSVIQSHEGLRLQLKLHDGEPVQYAAAYRHSPLSFFDFSLYPDPQGAYKAWVAGEAQSRYPLYDSPLYRISMFRIGEEDNGFLLRAHHIVCDGWSVDVLTRHILDLYERIRRHNTAGPEPVSPSYLTYLEMEETYLQSERCKKDKVYWENKFSLLPEPLFAQQPHTPAGRRLTRLMDEETVNRVKNAADSHQVSLPIFLGSAYGLLLSRFYQKDEVILAMPVANRNQATKAMAGMFTGNLPLSVQVKNNPPLHNFLRETKREYMRSLSSHKYPYDLLARQLQLRQNGRTVLAQASFNFYNTHLRTSLADGLKIENEEFYPGEQAYPLQLMIKDWSGDGTLLFSLDYQTGLIRDFEAESLLASLFRLLDEMTRRPEAEVYALSLLDKRQWENTVETYNSQSSPQYDGQLTVLDLFERQAAAHPERIAVSLGQEKMTYGELYGEVRRLSTVLAAIPDIRTGPVAIRMRHSPELIAAILAVIKTGTAFLPIALDVPHARAKFMLRDSGAVCLWQDNDNEEAWSVPVIKTSMLDAREGATDRTMQSVPSGCGADDSAYIIYTSGSTGEPKGVKIRHSSLANYIVWAASVYLKSDQDIFAFYSSLSFDLTLTSLFVPLTSGTQLRIYPPNQHGYTLSRIIQENQATVMKLTPSHLALLPDINHGQSALHTLIVGGESLKTSVAAKIQGMFGPELSIYNEYGPTEATVGCMIHRFNASADLEPAVPIGIPAANARLYILDKNKQMLPPGAMGELYISGPGIAEGYINRQTLTEERFLPDPFADGLRMYRTGDRVKLSEGYLMHYFGRHDDQVKIRGNRIEPEEIEHALLSLGGVREAVVFAAGEGQHAELFACVVLDLPEEAAGLKQTLSSILPPSLIPDRIAAVPEIPLTLNGKADKPRLADMIRSQLAPQVNQQGAEASYSDQLLSALRAVLEKEQIQLDDQFFALGGDSIKAIQVSSLLKTQGLDLNAASILDYPQIKDMLPHLKPDRNAEEQGMAVGAVIPAPIQSWFLAQQFENPDYYLQSILLEIADGITEHDLTEGLKALIRHHDSLRMFYDTSVKKLVYNPRLPVDDFQLEVIQVDRPSGDEEVQELEIEHKITAFKRYIQITSAEHFAFHACLIRMPGRKRRLLLAAHHLCIDGVSWRIVLEDLERAVVHQLPLPPKTASFQRWSRALAERSLPLFQSEVEVWKRIGEGGEHEGLAGKPWPPVRRSECLTQTFFFSQDESDLILRGPSGIRAAERLQTALVLAWQDEFPCEELTVWMEGHGREALFSDLDISRTVGWFTSLYPVKFLLHKGQEVKERTFAILRQLNEVPRNGIGYGVLAYSLKQIPPAAPGILFNYLGEFSLQEEKGFRLLQEAGVPDIAPENQFPFQLELNALTVDKQLQIRVMASPAVMDAERLERLIRGYRSRVTCLALEAISGMEEERDFKPEDFDAVDLTQQELDALFK